MHLGSDLIRLVDPVTEALREIEQGADEVLSPDEEVPVPTVRPGGRASMDQTTSRTPTATVQHSVRARALQHRSGVSKAELFVGLLALFVFGVSLFGLYWLLGRQ
jgi:hypothetical protein